MRIRILIPRRKPRKLVARRPGERSGQLPLIIVFVALLGSLVVLFGDNGLMAVMQMRGRAAQLRDDIDAAEHRNRALENAIQPLRNEDPQAIERLARERLHMARPGDSVFLLPPERRSQDTAPGVESRSPTAPALPGR